MARGNTIYGNGSGSSQVDEECVSETTSFRLVISARHPARPTTPRLTRFTVIKLLLAAIYINYTTTIIDDEGIEHIDHMIAAPVGDKLIVSFSRAPMD